MDVEAGADLVGHVLIEHAHDDADVRVQPTGVERDLEVREVVVGGEDDAAGAGGVGVFEERLAARVADEGFVVNARYAAVLKDNIETLARFPATCAVLLRPDGSPWQPGDRLRQRDLARSYRALADAGSRWFYRGRFAQATARSMRREGGLLTERDFARY
ncbi:MAG TPA: gamma-glutamyltransferase, partial [Phycisphaerae bacterium]|nr:gamma-glutamyltransferase [Phycisphaerae bacterium]